MVSGPTPCLICLLLPLVSLFLCPRNGRSRTLVPSILGHFGKPKVVVSVVRTRYTILSRILASIAECVICLVHQPLIGDNSTVLTVESESGSLYLLGLHSSPCVFWWISHLPPARSRDKAESANNFFFFFSSTFLPLFFLFHPSIHPSSLCIPSFFAPVVCSRKGKNFFFIYLFIFFIHFLFFQKRKKSIEINNPAHPKALYFLFNSSP